MINNLVLLLFFETDNLVLFVMQDIKLWRYVGGEVQTSKILVGIIHIRQEAGLFHHITPVSSEADMLDRPQPQASAVELT